MKTHSLAALSATPPAPPVPSHGPHASMPSTPAPAHGPRIPHGCHHPHLMDVLAFF